MNAERRGVHTLSTVANAEQQNSHRTNDASELGNNLLALGVRAIWKI